MTVEDNKAVVMRFFEEALDKGMFARLPTAYLPAGTAPSFSPIEESMLMLQ